MTIKFSAGNAPPVDLLAVADGLFQDLADELGRTLLAVKAGQISSDLRSAAQLVKELKDAFNIAMLERMRVDKLRQHTAGVAPGTALDFDAARDEIGRRLACLRDAGGGG